VNKTKVVAFKKGLKLAKDERWLYQGRKLEIAKTFKYLGVNLSYNGTWVDHQRRVAAIAEKGLYAARKALNRHNSISFKLATRTFNTLLQPILPYGCEVWGTNCVANVINKAGTKFIKQILGLAQSAPNSAVLLETGRYPISSVIKMRVLKY